MPYQYEIYIGSDNETKKNSDLYRGKIIEWANSVFPEGYTIFEIDGYYNGFMEESLLMSVLSEGEIEVKDHIDQLKRELRQDKILLTKHYVEVRKI